MSTFSSHSPLNRRAMLLQLGVSVLMAIVTVFLVQTERPVWQAAQWVGPSTSWRPLFQLSDMPISASSSGASR